LEDASALMTIVLRKQRVVVRVDVSLQLLHVVEQLQG
jgi:hypothetical protein